MMTLSASRYLLPLMAALATLPVWTGTLPLGTDIPQHAAQISLALDHFSSRAWADEVYVNYFTPYLLTYLAGALLAKAFGVVVSVKILISLYLGGTVLASARLLGAYGHDKRLAIFSIFGLYGFTYQWGFLPFNLSAVLMILLLAELRSSTQASLSNVLRCLGLAIAIVMTHGLSAVVMAGILLALTVMESGLAARVRNYVLVLMLLIPVICWQLFTPTGVKGFGNGIYFGIHPLLSPYFFYQEMSTLNHHAINGWGRLSGLFPRVLGWRNGTAATLAGSALLAAPFLFGCRLNTDRKAMALAAILLLILLFMPSVINGSLYSAERFSLLFLCFMPLLIAPTHGVADRLMPWLMLASTVFVAGNVIQARDYDQSMSDLSDVVARLPEGQRGLFLSYTYKADGFIAPVFLHSGQWYGVLKNGLVDPSFAATDLQPLRYFANRLPFATIGNGFDWSPAAYDWSDIDEQKYRVYLIHGSISAFAAHTGCKTRHDLNVHGPWSAVYMNRQDVSRCNGNKTLKEGN